MQTKNQINKMISHLLALVEYFEEMLAALVTENGMRDVTA
jgi:hypothetical protein